MKAYVVFDPNEFEGIEAVCSDRKLAVELCDRLEEVGAFPPETLQTYRYPLLTSKEEIESFVKQIKEEKVF